TGVQTCALPISPALIGAAVLVQAGVVDTTTDSGGNFGDRIHNLRLLSNRVYAAIAGKFTFLAGVVLLGLDGPRAALHPASERTAAAEPSPAGTPAKRSGETRRKCACAPRWDRDAFGAPSRSGRCDLAPLPET